LEVTLAAGRFEAERFVAFDDETFGERKASSAVAAALHFRCRERLNVVEILGRVSGRDRRRILAASGARETCRGREGGNGKQAYVKRAPNRRMSEKERHSGEFLSP
jgi:hypothetical protein